MSNAKETVLVTGGAGFIGSHLVDRLVDSGCQAIVVDDLSSGRESNLPSGAELEKLDIRNPGLKELVARVNPSRVFHVAAQISVSVSAREPALDADINIMGSLNLLDAVRESGPAKVMFVSTGGAMYGEPEQLPADESLPPQPFSPYGASKLAVENYLPVYKALYGIDYSIIRPANVYGPRQDPHGEAGVIAIFTRAMLSDSPFKIFGDGNDERDYIFVGDVVEALIAASHRGGTGPYNAGTGIGTSVNSLFSRLAELCDYDKPAQHAPPRAGDLHKISLDSSRAKKELDWSPNVDIEDGLRTTVDWFRKHG